MTLFSCVFAVAAHSSGAADTVPDGKCGGLAAVDNLLVDPVHLPAQQQGEHHLPHGRQAPALPLQSSYDLERYLTRFLGRRRYHGQNQQEQHGRLSQSLACSRS